MAPKSPWTKKATITNNSISDNTVQPAVDYGEAQIDEIEVLRAIYMEDFEDLETKSAWSKTTDRTFKLKLRPFSDPDSCVTLSVQLTATYPRTVPLLDVQGLHSYHERTQRRIHNIVNNRPKQLIGDVMIHAIASDIQDALEDAVQARRQGTLPSLEEERATAEEEAAILAKQAEEVDARRRQEAQDEEERLLQQMVDDEVRRREQRRSSRTLDVPDTKLTPGQDEIIAFDQPVTLTVNNDIILFTSLLTITRLSQQSNEETVLAKPHVYGGSLAPIVSVKRIGIERSREDVMDIENELETVSKLRHSSLLTLLAFRIERLDLSRSRLIVCQEYMCRGSLNDLLQFSGLHLNKARQFTIELLEALEFIHRSGIWHGGIEPSNIVITDSPVTPKFANLGFCALIETNPPSSKWKAPEGVLSSSNAKRKVDIWQFGILVLQMFLGLQVTSEYGSPQLMLSKLDFSIQFEDFLHKIFVAEPRKRSSAFELLPSEFLRTDEPVLESTRAMSLPASLNASRTSRDLIKHRSRHNSTNIAEAASRYANDFTEMGRLGKGGFGEVVKARNKLDGGIYAIKKIKQAPQLLDQVISEVMLLNRLNHPYVVRYFSTWVEEEAAETPFDDSSTATETISGIDRLVSNQKIHEEAFSEGPRIDFGYQSTGGLDFVSSSGFPQIEFGDDSEDEGPDDHETSDNIVFEENEEAVTSERSNPTGEPRLRKSKSDSRRANSVLYIQMEYCERRTLRDFVRKAMTIDETWRYAREITEGLAHIHGHGIIHRDLKPDNIFIDVAGNPKIGDFGLATTTQYYSTDRSLTMSGRAGGDMTRSIGTTLYVAPELRSTAATAYSDKVDMYSLGIILFEMCQYFSTAMERVRALQEIRAKDHNLPSEYQPNKEKAAQGRLISCLISHKPSERPSSTELLRSDILPVKIEDETIRQALSGLSDPRSPYHQKTMSALFAHDSAAATRVKSLAWDARAPNTADTAERMRLRNTARQSLEKIFRRHGAEETQRQTIFPRSAYNTNANVVQLLDASGNLLQLPYDLTIPHARQLSQYPTEVRCTYSFGIAYRDAFTGGPPRTNEEVDFDIVNTSGGREAVFDDAEVLKVMDEVLCEVHTFAPATVSFNISHASILDAILEHCRVPIAQHSAVNEILSKLGFNNWNWGKTRVELRKFGLPDTTLDDMQQFDFRDTPVKAFNRINDLFANANPRVRSQLEMTIKSLGDMIRLGKEFGIQRKLYIVPLASVKAVFYEGGMLFQCVLERKANRLVVAAGGRYDNLIKAQRAAEIRGNAQGAVGVALSLDFILSNMARTNEHSTKKAYLKDDIRSETLVKRCEVLVVANGIDAVRNVGIKILATLWSNDISAELAKDSKPWREKDHGFIVTIRHEASTSVRLASTADDGEEVDVPISALVAQLSQELREREGAKSRPTVLHRQTSHQDTELKGNVQVLMARHGSKKSNKYQVVSDAQQQWAQKLDTAKNAPILAVETRDDVLDLVQLSRLSDPETWRKTIHSVQLNDRQYVQQIYEILQSWRKTWMEGDGVREACVFNFRTQTCIYYDLGL